MKTTRLFTALFFIFAISFSQDEDKKSSNNFVFDGNLEFQKERFSDAEYNYRKATSFDSLNYNKSINYIPVDEISIKINEYKKWQVNNIRILTNNSHLIPDKFKKKFNDNWICL